MGVVVRRTVGMSGGKLAPLSVVVLAVSMSWARVVGDKREEV